MRPGASLLAGVDHRPRIFAQRRLFPAARRAVSWSKTSRRMPLIAAAGRHSPGSTTAFTWAQT